MAQTVPYLFEECPMEHLVSMVADMLERLLRHNDQIPLHPDALTRFHSRTAPSISVLDYLRRVVRYTNLERACLLITLHYIDQMCGRRPRFTISSLTVHRFLIASVCVSTKALCDAFCTNTHYAKIGGIKLAELNVLEREFLSALEWRLICSPELLQEYYVNLARSHSTGAFKVDDPPPSVPTAAAASVSPVSSSSSSPKVENSESLSSEGLSTSSMSGESEEASSSAKGVRAHHIPEDGISVSAGGGADTQMRSSEGDGSEEVQAQSGTFKATTVSGSGDTTRAADYPFSTLSDHDSHKDEDVQMDVPVPVPLAASSAGSVPAPSSSTTNTNHVQHSPSTHYTSPTTHFTTSPSTSPSSSSLGLSSPSNPMSPRKRRRRTSMSSIIGHARRRRVDKPPAVPAGEAAG